MFAGVDEFRLASVLMIAVGAGFIGSGIGMAIATHRKPTIRSGWNSTVVSTIVGVAIIAFALYRGAPWMDS